MIHPIHFADAERFGRILGEVGMEEGEAALRLVHAEALLATGDLEQAREALRVACDRILEVAAKLEDPQLRASFTGNIEEHARTLELAREHLTSEA